MNREFTGETNYIIPKLSGTIWSHVPLISLKAEEFTAALPFST
jgi:hypothetical protein